ncbi:hypothetical protein TNCV_1553771 [Trichonephila clavipes]|nr:hypothetical protein TNCV_1553771 [Trichonephila clavipes]
MGEVRWEFAFGRLNLDLKDIPLRTDKISRHWIQDTLLPFVAPILGSTEAVHMNSLNVKEAVVLKLSTAASFMYQSDIVDPQDFEPPFLTPSTWPSDLKAPQSSKDSLCYLCRLFLKHFTGFQLFFENITLY